MKRHVLGYAFALDPLGQYPATVLLIHKKRPAFLAGMWNGIGGKIEPGETGLQAMVREFKEECGITTRQKEWERIAHAAYPSVDSQMDVYRCFLPISQLLRYRTMTDEVVCHFDVDRVLEDGGKSRLTITQEAQYFIPMAIDRRERYAGVVHVDGK